jgi:hypothetical protein
MMMSSSLEFSGDVLLERKDGKLWVKFAVFPQGKRRGAAMQLNPKNQEHERIFQTLEQMCRQMDQGTK